MNKKQNCNEKDCSKIEHCAVELVAYTMKMQCEITKKLEEARAYDCKVEEIMKKARVLENKSDALMKEAEEMSKQLEIQLKKANVLMFKTIECYKENCEEQYCCNEGHHHYKENNCGGYTEEDSRYDCNNGYCFEEECYSSNNCRCNGNAHVNECYRQGYGNNGFRYEEGHNMNSREDQTRYWHN
ncbi:MAG: hypothetical protein ACRDAU_07785 [Clostridium sp.]